MSFNSSLMFYGEETYLNEELGRLFVDWFRTVENQKNGCSFSSSSMVFDGFYPNYTHQPVKVLFVGREPRGLGGENYIDNLFDAYVAGCIDDKNIDDYSFHNIMFRTCYAIVNSFSGFDKIPLSSEISRDAFTGKGISFAFMNLSKISNDGYFKTNWSVLDDFSEVSCGGDVNYFNREISILNPDIIITMNLEGRLKSLGELDVIDMGDKVSYYQLSVGDKKIPLLDTFHFTAFRMGKSERFDLYEPIAAVCKKYDLLYCAERYSNEGILNFLSQYNEFSVAKIQRHCRWGYTRAIAKIIELVDLGLVGEVTGKPFVFKLTRNNKVLERSFADVISEREKLTQSLKLKNKKIRIWFENNKSNRNERYIKNVGISVARTVVGLLNGGSENNNTIVFNSSFIERMLLRRFAANCNIKISFREIMFHRCDSSTAVLLMDNTPNSLSLFKRVISNGRSIRKIYVIGGDQQLHKCENFVHRNYY